MGTYKKIPYFLSTVLLTASCGDNNSKNSISNSKPQESLSNNLFHQQWYLKNIGQELFGTEVAKENFDINLTIPNSYTGSNVKVLVADSGVDFNHPNLNKSILNNSSIDFTVSSPLPFENINPKLTIGINSEDTEEDHGTNVAGIIGANPLDNKFTGIAPRVQIASANVVSKFINKSTLSIVDKRLKIYNHAENKEINIINESYGSKSENFFNDANKIINKNINDTIKNNYRIENKKGFIIVKSAGNYSCDSEEALFNETKEEIIYDYINNSKLLTDSEKLYFKSLRPNLSQTNLISSNPYTITVANATAHGIINKSSSIGANIWITAFGGGNHSAQKHDNLMSAYPNIPINNILLDWKNKYLPNIFSTRIHNTNESIDSSLKYADLREEEKKYYTTDFSGTSAAAPMVTGVIALMLQANPNLTLRDVKYILAKTANSDIVKNFEPKPYCIKILQRIGGFNDNFNTLWDEEQWVSNKANFKFNNYYGFGLINADKAIEEAKSSDYPKFKGKAF
ncbi:MAG: S8 family serine peptidase, partial [Silvanigrellaceae bacterium]|nr:S8 family serine peptidase [Silvanigrellaceae bacterium]